MRQGRTTWRRAIRWMVALALGLIATAAGAQPFPSKPVRVIIPYTAGGPADVLMRAIALKLTDQWGQQVLVDNRPGANEMIAAEAVAKSAPDGYTLLLATDAVFSLNQHLYAKVPYDPVRDFTPLTRVVNAHMLMIARPDFPPKTVGELIDYAKANPGKVTYASVGAGGVVHLAMAWFNTLYGLQMEHVPYKGLVQALQDMTTSRVDMMLAVSGGAMPFVNSGKLKAYAVSGKTRPSIAPNVPTFAEAGYKDYEAFFYFAVAGPGGMNSALAERLSSDIGKIVIEREFREKYLQNLGFEPVAETPAQFSEFLKGDRELAAKRVKAANVKLD